MVEYCLLFLNPPFPKILLEVLFVKRRLSSLFHSQHVFYRLLTRICSCTLNSYVLELLPKRLYHVMVNIFKFPSSHYHCPASQVKSMWSEWHNRLGTFQNVHFTTLGLGPLASSVGRGYTPQVINMNSDELHRLMRGWIVMMLAVPKDSGAVQKMQIL